MRSNEKIKKYCNDYNIVAPTIFIDSGVKGEYALYIAHSNNKRYAETIIKSNVHFGSVLRKAYYLVEPIQAKREIIVFEESNDHTGASEIYKINNFEYVKAISTKDPEHSSIALVLEAFDKIREQNKKIENEEK